MCRLHSRARRWTTDSLVSVSPNTPVAATTTHSCPASVTAGSTLTCSIVTRDAYGNVAGGSSQAATLSASLMRGSGLSYTGTVSYSGSTGSYSVSFVPTEAGRVTLSLQVLSVAVPSQGEGTTVNPAAAVASNCVLSCSGSAVVSASFVCSVTLKDTYGNPTGTSLSEAQAYGLVVAVTGAGNPSVVLGLDGSSSVGVYTASSVPQSGTRRDQAELEEAAGHSAAGSGGTTQEREVGDSHQQQRDHLLL